MSCFAHCSFVEARYPQGYQLEWVDDPQTHAGVQAAFKLNQQRVPTP
jgi:hypothetical protein